MRVIGTAGHVDHGKSTLVKALTGVHPDRLKEEQEREMTIELGFAWMTLPDGESVGIVDVPGHRDFIENMLAGVGGIDAVLFVVAADEGVMPQTREHLAILNILQINGGIIVLTKIDMIDDADWLDLVEEDVRQAVAGTVLEGAPVVRVSATSGDGVSELIQELEKSLSVRPPKPDLGRARLPVDRIFTISGFGTVVTGTLLDGKLSVGDEVLVLPQELRGRVRGLQAHKEKEVVAVPGSRTAVNITGIDVNSIQRGDVIIHPKSYQATRRIDVHFRLLPEATRPIKHNDQVKLYIGASEMISRVRLLGLDELIPGGEGWLQLEMREPIVAARGDRYILRRPSPSETLGGGVVLDPHPKSRYKRFNEQGIERLKSLLRGSPEEVLFQACLVGGVATIRTVVNQARLGENEAEEALQELLEERQILLLEEGEVQPNADLLVITRQRWEEESQKVVRVLSNYHETFFLRRGMPREELKSRLKYASRNYNASLRQWVSNAVVMEDRTIVHLPGFTVQFTPEQKGKVDNLLERFAQSAYTPPTIKECREALGDELYAALVEKGELVPVSSEVVFTDKVYQDLIQTVKNHFQKEDTLTAAQLRDQLKTTRRYVLAFLEHLDALGVTLRDGDFRRFGN
jgi:selenocysteine-specific elongation factor